MEINHDGSGSAQSAVYRRAQDARFVRDYHKGQEVVGKGEQVQHECILQQDLLAVCQLEFRIQIRCLLFGILLFFPLQQERRQPVLAVTEKKQNDPLGAGENMVVFRRSVCGKVAGQVFQKLWDQGVVRILQ